MQQTRSELPSNRHPRPVGLYDLRVPSRDVLVLRPDLHSRDNIHCHAGAIGELDFDAVVVGIERDGHVLHGFALSLFQRVELFSIRSTS
ncbi:MAG: hypothetical protein JWO91_3685 [Acidobacteriaceae bacterium]|nr:hypothetical protein [Acidobacteriaceae bacterium]